MIPKMMKAVVQTGPGILEYKEIPTPVIEQPTDVIVRFTLGSICTSDVHLLPMFFEERAVGHEFCGEVVEVGPAVKNVKVGEHYMVKPALYCGECEMCKLKMYTICENGGAMNTLAMYGCFSEYVRVMYAHNTLVPIPAGCTEEDVLMNADVLTTGRFLVENAGIKEGDVVAINGVGPIGMAACLVAKQIFKARKVIAIDINDFRLNKCLEHKIADYIINPNNDDLYGRIDEITHSRGVDLAGDTSAMPNFVDTLVNITRPQGAISSVGTTFAQVPFTPSIMMAKNIKMFVGTQDFNGMEEMQEMIGRGEIDVKWMQTHKAPMNDTIKGFEVFGKHEDNVLKWLVEPWDHNRE